jgi:hypothetical protein
MRSLSDEWLCEGWLENPDYQLFCSETFFRICLPPKALDDPPASGRERGADDPAAGEPAPGHPHRGSQAGRLHPCRYLHHRAAVDPTISAASFIRAGIPSL